MTRNLIPLSRPLRDARLLRTSDRAALRGEEIDAAFQRGRLEGERAVSEQLIQQRAEVIELQTGILTSLRQALPQVIRDGERTLINLALEIAQRAIVGVPISVEMIEAAVREACTEIEDRSEFTIRLHPEDLALLEKMHSPLLLPQSPNEKIRFEAAPHVTRGGCMVQTRFGLIDARRETKFARLQEAISA